MQNSPISWVGGKSKLVNTLIDYLPDHKGYVEVFGGAGWLLFGKEPSNWEVLNDLDGDLINLWSIIKEAPDQFIKSFEYSLISRRTFNEYKEAFKKENYDDCIQRAHIFYYLVRAAFASRMSNPSFGTGKGSSNLKIDKIKDDINRAHQRLKRVTIENLSFEHVFRIYDSRESFFFLDPPYRESCRYAVGHFTDQQYSELASICKSIKGKFLLTINDDEYVNELFKDFIVKKHKVRYSISGKQSGRRNFGELIIMNYEQPFQQERLFDLE